MNETTTEQTKTPKVLVRSSGRMGEHNEKVKIAMVCITLKTIIDLGMRASNYFD